ncbi:MAG: 2Fe-2S iron-sulfur cluster binding domain-containing protein, partial [Spirochaetales bacterium]
MKRIIRFRLNESLYEEEVRDESLALDWIRNTAGLKGTKEGCREGDCGACLVLMGGSGPNGTIEWKAVTSCTLAMGELDGRHLITIEGLASAGLTPVMEAMLDEGASQCGFCSPGFILALTGFLISGERVDPVAAMAAVEGNLCRCTGYGSIRRAAARLAAGFSDLPAALESRLGLLADRGVLPAGLAATMASPPGAIGSQEAAFASIHPADTTPVHLGGGTDYFVRNPDPEPELAPHFSDLLPETRSIRSVTISGNVIIEMGAAVTTDDFFGSPTIRAAVPGIERFAANVASPPIRSRA